MTKSEVISSIVLGTVVVIFISTITVMLAWNGSLVPLFGLPAISFMQSFWLSVLANTLVRLPVIKIPK